jgi:hypothetical protein
MIDLAPSPRIQSLARATLQDLHLISSLSPSQRADVVMVAFDILREARIARLGATPAFAATVPVTYLTRADFRAGRQGTHRRPRMIVRPTTPGDAA